MGRFDGKVCLLTGAGGSIGGATARRFASEGAKVLVCDLCAETAERTADEIRAVGGVAAAQVLDVTDPTACDAAVSACVKTFGGLDVMVHVAGGSARGKAAPLVEQTDDVIRSVLDVNLFGAIWMCRAAARAMQAQGRGGRLICLSSALAFCGLGRFADYSAAKGGVVSFVKALAKEVGPDGITVNAVAPGIVMRPDETGGEARALGTNVLHQKCVPDDIASAILYLASDEAHFVTGATLMVDGGRSLSLKGTD